MAAALCGDFDECIGIEILPSLHEISIGMADMNPTSSLMKFHLGSIVDREKGELNWWTNADVVYANCVCFDDKLLDTIVELASQMRVGTHFITLNFSLPPDKESGFTLIGSRREPMSWGNADFFIHKKIS